MSKQQETLRLALEALENTTPTGFNMERDKQFFAAIAAIKEALAQPDGCQCPACKVTPHASDCAVHNEPAYPKGKCNCGAQPEHSPNCALLKIPSKDCDCQDQQESVAITITGKLGNIYSFTGDYSLKKGDKVYTTPPQRKPWAGLTEQEHTDIAVECGCMSSDLVFYGATVERLLKEKNS